VSELWLLRRGRLFLLPGDSPIGFRLPLNALPHISPAAYPHVFPADPFAPRGDLPAPPAGGQRIAHRGVEQAAPARIPGIPDAATLVLAAPAQRSAIAVRTALTVEPRDGRLCVFMPPTERLEDYLALLAAVGYSIYNVATSPEVQSFLSFMTGALGSGFVFVNLLSLLQRSVRPQMVGRASGVFLTTLFGAASTAGYLMGSLVGNFGWGTAALIELTLFPVIAIAAMLMVNPKQLIPVAKSV